MTQIFGILGFFMALLAIFIASESIRRTNHRMLELETAFYKLSGRIQKAEARVLEIEKGANLSPADIKRQKETLIALEKKTRANRAERESPPATTSASARGNASSERYTPSEYKKKTLGIG